MELLINYSNRFFSLLFLPFERMRPEYALFAISAVTGVVMLYLYKWTSNQKALGAVQQKIKAGILEIQLYKNDIYVMLRALARVFRRNMTYLKLLLPPALALMAIVALIVVQMYPRFQYRPLRPGEGAVVKAALTVWPEDAAASVRLSVPEGVTVEAGPVAVPARQELSWRIRADRGGEYPVTVEAGRETQAITLSAGGGLAAVTPSRAPLGLGSYLASPAATPIPPGSAFTGIAIKYPERDIRSPLMLGMGWIVYFFVASFLVALAAKFAFKVK